MRIALLMIVLALAACRTTDEPAPTATPAAPPAGPASAATPAASPPETPARRGAPQALRGSPPPPVSAPQPEPALSTEEQVLAIRQGCWSAVDKNRAIKTLEARADWVSKCIADKTKAQIGQ